jgi:hypothetical protein
MNELALKVLHALVVDGYQAARIEGSKVFVSTVGSSHIETINNTIDFSGCGSRSERRHMEALLADLVKVNKESTIKQVSKLQEVARLAKKGEFQGDYNDLTDAVNAGYCSISDAMNQDF